jgi:hypothetical protein
MTAPRALALGVVIALVAGAGVAAGAIPDSGGTIHGCYTKTGGILRVVDTDRNQHCISAVENDISWGQRGPQGDTGPAGTTGQDAHTAFSTSPIPGGPGSAFTAVPGMRLTVDVPENAVLYVSTDGGMDLVNTSPDASALIDVGIAVDGASPTPASYRRTSLRGGPSTAYATWNLGHALTVPAGTHTFEVQSRLVDGNVQGTDLDVGGGPSTDAALQGQLTVQIMKH